MSVTPLQFTARVNTVLLCLFLSACSVNPHYDPSKAHHTRSGFQNPGLTENKGFLAFLRWRWQRLFKTIPAADAYNFKISTQHHAKLKDNRNKNSLTWIGHASFLLQFNGLNILTDPQFSHRASPFSWLGPQRVVAPAIDIDALPDIDVIIISHDHYDSLDVDSVQKLARHNRQRTLHFVVPLGMNSWFEDLSLPAISVTELDWGQSTQIGEVRFIAEPSQHWGKRTLFDAFERLWASWVIESDQQRIFFAGDSGYAPLFKQIGAKYRYFDVALLPIGAYEPRWFMRDFHVNPEEAVHIHRDIGSRYSVAMHWGTFLLTDEPLDEPPVKLAEALRRQHVNAAEFEVWQHGETRFIPVNDAQNSTLKEGKSKQ